MIGHQDTEIIDDGKVFVIDKDTKEISGEMLIISQFMNKSERVTLKMPRYIEGHDMLLCNYVTIHYDNVSTDRESVNSDVYEVEDLKLKEGTDDVLTFTWLITSNATQLVGTVEISVHFDCLTDGVSVYSWGTTVSRLIRILESKNNSPSVIANNSDILQQHTDKIDKLNENVEALSKKHNGDLQAANERIDTANDEIAKTNKAVENLNKSLTQSIESVGESANKAITSVNESATQGIAEVNKKIDELPQPDLAQNDPTANDYVKNRTHRKYIEEVDLVPEMSVDLKNGVETFYVGDAGYVALELGKTYNVYLDGVKYENLAVKNLTLDDIVVYYIGNDPTDNSFSELPFAYSYRVDIGASTLAYNVGTTTVTFRLFEKTEIYEPFDGRYLPNGLGYIISEGSQTATHTLTWDGDMSGKETVDILGDGSMYLVKMSDSTCTVDDLIGGTFTLAAISGETNTIEITSDEVEDLSSEGLPCIQVDGQFVWIMLEDFSAEGLTFTKGIWFLNVAAVGYYTSALTALTDCFVAGTAAEVQMIDERLIGDWVARKRLGEEEVVPTFTDTTTSANLITRKVDEVGCFAPVVGQKYYVYLNGVRYECTAVEMSLGNNNPTASGFTIPDVLSYMYLGTYGIYQTQTASETVTIRITTDGYVYDKIPEEYLPDSIINSTIPEFDLVTLGLPSMTLDGEKVSLNDYNILNLCATAKNSPIKITFNVDGATRTAILRDVVIVGEFYSWTAAWSNFGGASPNETANCVLKLTAWITEGQMYAWAYTIPTASTLAALEARIAALEGAAE